MWAIFLLKCFCTLLVHVYQHVPPLPLLAIGIMISERDNKCGPFLDQWIF